MLSSNFIKSLNYWRTNKILFSNIYKSAYNIENLYPNFQEVDHDKMIREKIKECSDRFSGYIPIGWNLYMFAYSENKSAYDVQISYSKSSGPGGQNVNKVNTKVEIRFHVPSAKWIPESLKESLKHKEAGRITKEGFLVVTSDKTRKQILNQADCFDKIRIIIWACQENTYTPSEHEIEKFKKSQEKAKKGILREKREHSLKKQSRSSHGIYDV